jgi:hypothetical protein
MGVHLRTRESRYLSATTFANMLVIRHHQRSHLHQSEKNGSRRIGCEHSPRTPAGGLEATLPQRHDTKPQTRHYIRRKSTLLARELRKSELLRKLGDEMSHAFCVDTSPYRIQLTYERSMDWAVVR